MEKDKINQEAKKSERLSNNIALGVSAFVLAVIIFIEVVIKSGVK